MIVYERHNWEPREVYYFRSHHGNSFICEVAKCGDWWLLWFYRGSANPGPFWYLSFDKAKGHVMRYLAPREHWLAGEPIRSAGTQAADTHPPSINTRHPTRKPRRKEWWKDS